MATAGRTLLVLVALTTLGAAADAPPAPTTPAAAAAAAATFPEQVDAALKKFDAAIAREVLPIQRTLDKWRADRRRQAMAELGGLLRKTEGGDKVYLAWAVLAANPKNKDARAVFTKLAIPAPIDEKGQPVPGAKTPICGNRELVDKVSSLAAPPFDAVAKVVDNDSPSVRSYCKRQKSYLDALKDELLALARSAGEPRATEAVFTMLAYYHPRAPEVAQYWQAQGKPVPRNRTWFNPIDAYLLDHELAGIDCLRTKSKEGVALGGNGKDPVTLNGSASWRFLEVLGNCRLEAMLQARAGQQPRFTIADDQGHGVALRLDGKRIEVFHAGGDATPLAGFAVEQDLTAVPVPVSLEVRGDRVRVGVAGLQIGECRLPRPYAYAQVRMDGAGATAQQLRLRFLADEPQPLIGDDEPTVAQKPATGEPEKPVEAWRAQREKDLDQPVSFAFNDQSFEEVAALFSQITGVAFRLDERAAALKDLPVTLSGSEIKLRTALEWLNRLTDIDFEPTAEGVTCTWHG